jgi:hypothetical protein
MLDIIGLTHMELYISFEQLKVGDDKKKLNILHLGYTLIHTP